MLVVKVIPGETVGLFDSHGNCVAVVKFVQHQGAGIRLGFACPSDISVFRDKLMTREHIEAASKVG